MRAHLPNFIYIMLALTCCSVVEEVESFTSGVFRTVINQNNNLLSSSSSSLQKSSPIILHSSVQNFRDDDEWKGEVTTGGTMRGCTVQQVQDSVTEFTIRIDGVEADLGRFSKAIFTQMITDAKQQRFQGFRPGTIPPQLYKTYRAFAMDECARETVLEAMQQNNIRPFTNAREGILIEQVSIPPPPPPPQAKKKKKKYPKKKKKNDDEVLSNNIDADDNNNESMTSEDEVVLTDEPPSTPQWQSFDTMDDAIKAGWAPGQSFSFVAKNVKGQNVLSDTSGAKPLGTKIVV
ncbi:MAG: hypothetical protein ACI8RD_007677 [Bacillariaceae sp.]|jgi:hypothetical protein